jgi:hypothetical protein
VDRVGLGFLGLGINGPVHDMAVFDSGGGPELARSAIYYAGTLAAQNAAR